MIHIARIVAGWRGEGRQIEDQTQPCHAAYALGASPHLDGIISTSAECDRIFDRPVAGARLALRSCRAGDLSTLFDFSPCRLQPQSLGGAKLIVVERAHGIGDDAPLHILERFFERHAAGTRGGAPRQSLPPLRRTSSSSPITGWIAHAASRLTSFCNCRTLPGHCAAIMRRSSPGENSNSQPDSAQHSARK